MSFSIIEYYGKQTRSNCGYCKQKHSSYSHGMHAYVMTPDDYQELINRGWRRSGDYCYKQTNNITCCPSYTIRCDAINFKLSKSHKKILKKMNNFLKNGVKDHTEAMSTENKKFETDSGRIKEDPEPPNCPKHSIKDITGEMLLVEPVPTSSVKLSNVEQDGYIKDIESPSEHVKLPFKKAKQIRLERKKEKLIKKGISLDSMKKKETKTNCVKSLSDLINDVSETNIHQLKLKIVEVNSDEFHESSDEAYKLFQKYQTIIHNDPPRNKESFLNFLQRSPIKLLQPEDGPTDGYGSFHQQYWLDDKLIAVGVMDILPYCISSVYFFYDPDYRFLSLGTYSALREIYFIHQLNDFVPSLKYYYMGFYIHSCPKMRYKGRLEPSYLLCPEKYTWHLLTDKIRAKLDAEKYQKFNNDSESTVVDEFERSDIDSVLILCQRNTYVTYRILKNAKNINIDSSLLEYGQLVGKICAHRMLYVNF